MLEGDPVKVVIWDMDDTFWRGTLAEGDEVEPFEGAVARLKLLADRGVISTISSKNDFAAVEAKLVRAARATRPRGRCSPAFSNAAATTRAVGSLCLPVDPLWSQGPGD